MTFFKRNWLLTLFVIAVLGISSYLLYLSQQPPKLSEAPTPSVPKTSEPPAQPKPPVGDTSQGGHWHGDEWHADPHDTPTPAQVETPESAETSTEMTTPTKQTAQSGGVAPQVKPGAPPIKSSEAESQVKPVSEEITPRFKTMEEVRKEVESKRAKGMYRTKEGWYSLPTDGRHWSENHLPENLEEIYAHDPEALSVIKNVQTILKYRDSSHPDLDKANTELVKFYQDSTSYSQERRHELLRLTWPLLDKPPVFVW